MLNTLTEQTLLPVAAFSDAETARSRRPSSLMREKVEQALFDWTPPPAPVEVVPEPVGLQLRPTMSGFLGQVTSCLHDEALKSQARETEILGRAAHQARTLVLGADEVRLTAEAMTKHAAKLRVQLARLDEVEVPVWIQWAGQGENSHHTGCLVSVMSTGRDRTFLVRKFRMHGTERRLMSEGQPITLYWRHSEARHLAGIPGGLDYAGCLIRAEHTRLDLGQLSFPKITQDKRMQAIKVGAFVITALLRDAFPQGKAASRAKAASCS